MTCPPGLPGLGLSVQMRPASSHAFPMPDPTKAHGQTRAIARGPEKTRHCRLLCSRLPRPAPQARARRQVSSTATSTAYSLPRPVSKFRGGRRLLARAVAVCAAAPARRRGGDGVPRQAGARAHGPRGNSSRSEPLPRIRWLEFC